MSRARMVIVLVMLTVLALTLTGAVLTRGVMADLPFLQARKGSWTGAYVPLGIVDQRPWQTAATLAALAQSAEEKKLARDAERLADHEVDQAFSQSLRQASLAQPKLTDKALASQKRANELQETVRNDEARIAALSAAAGAKSAGTISNGSDLEIAKAQLGLDQAELADSIEDLARESGDQRLKLQQELAARQAAMKQYKDRDSEDDGQTAVISAEQYRTLAQQLSTWRSLRNRKQLIAQAEQLAKDDVAALTADREKLRAEAASLAAKPVRESDSERIERLQRISTQQNILSILNDRLGAQQQLVGLYGRWGQQVELQQKIVIHLILQSLAFIAAICIMVILAGWGLQLALEKIVHDSRQTQLLKTGNWTAHGHPTGRRVSFLNGYAIRGKYFNFSTVGQWMWDEIKVSVPPGTSIHLLLKSIYEATVKITEADAKRAEAEWKRVTHEEGSPQFSAMPS